MHNSELQSMIRSVCGTSEKVDQSSEELENVCGKFPYREIDGRCNNVRLLEWGANYAPLQRFLSPDYSDGKLY